MFKNYKLQNINILVFYYIIILFMVSYDSDICEWGSLCPMASLKMAWRAGRRPCSRANSLKCIGSASIQAKS